MKASRRNFLRGIAGASLLGAGGCCGFGRGQKIRLAVVGVMGQGFSNWLPMLRSGLVEIVAFCDCDRRMQGAAQARLIRVGCDYDLSRVPFYTDYRRLLDDASLLGVDAMTVSTTDHTHAPIAIGAMRQGIHVFVETPLVRTLWELDRFRSTAEEYGVIVQMGNQDSALDGFRRGVEVLQSGIIGDVTEVHVWTDRPAWPQGLKAASCTKGAADPIPDLFNWDCWLATAANRPYKGAYPQGAKGHDPMNRCSGVYHPFSWRGFHDFGGGALGDMGGHGLNLPFRGLELGEIESAECVFIEEKNGIAFPRQSTVVLNYPARVARFGRLRGKTLPAVRLVWYDGSQQPPAELFPDGKVPAASGCLVRGRYGMVFSATDGDGKCQVAMNGEARFTPVDQRADCTFEAIPQTIARYPGDAPGLQSVAVAGNGQRLEFLTAITGSSPVYAETRSRCYSDIGHSVPLMQGVLAGVVAQRVAGRLAWNGVTRQFDSSEANELLKPYVREGFGF